MGRGWSVGGEEVRGGGNEEEYRTPGSHGGQGETGCFDDVHYVRPRVLILIGDEFPPFSFIPARCLQLIRVVPIPTSQKSKPLRWEKWVV